MADIIPIRNSWITLAITAILIGAVAIFFHNDLKILMHRIGFAVGMVVLIILYVFTVIHWAITFKEPVYEYFSPRMIPVVIVAAIMILWMGCWSADYRTNKESHIEYNPTK